MSAIPERQVEELSRTHRHIAVLAAHDVLRDWALAEDAAQLAFVLILNRLRTGDAGLLDRPEATVRRNARWAAMKIRSSRLHSETAEDRYGRYAPADDTELWSSSEARFACEAILESLPEHYREAIRLRFFRQLPDAVAASQLRVTLRAYRRRLDRALLLARSVAAEIGLRGAAAAIAAIQGVRGVLYRLRHLGDLGVAWGNPVATATALVMIALAPVVPEFAAAAPHRGDAGPQAAATLPSDPAATTTIARSAAGGRGVAARAASANASSGPALDARPVPHLAGAADETPGDTSFYSVAAAPSDSGSGSGALVAIGWGNSCGCNVVFESTDGWHTWRAAEGPGTRDISNTTQVSLPPAYPSDPRIFLGSVALGYWDMVSPGLGAPFQKLPITGYIKLPPSFEQTGSFFVTATDGMNQFALSGLTLSADRTRPVIFDPPLVGEDVLAAPAAGSQAAFAMVGYTSIMQMGGGGIGGYDIGTGGLPELYGCYDAGSCKRVSAAPAGRLYGLAVSPQFASDHALAVYGAPDVAFLSRDSGQSFVQLPDPGGSPSWVSVSSTGGTVVVWALVSTHSGWSLLRWDGGAAWQAVSPPAWGSSRPSGIHPLALGTDRVVVFDDRAGALCTADGGQTWAEVCPA